MIEVEVLGGAAAPGGVPPAGGDRAPVRARGRAAAASRTGTSRSSSSTRERIAELNAAHRGKAEPTDVLSFPIDGAGGGGRTSRASSATS